MGQARATIKDAPGNDVSRKFLFRRFLPAIALLYLVFSVLAGIAIADISLKLPRRPLAHPQMVADIVHKDFQTELQNISITAADGAMLKAWFIHPHQYNGNAVVLLHGITDNREGVAGYGDLLLAHGYAVLLPDARRHGESGGELATYGLKESDDI